MFMKLFFLLANCLVGPLSNNILPLCFLPYSVCIKQLVSSYFDSEGIIDLSSYTAVLSRTHMTQPPFALSLVHQMSTTLP